MKNKNLSLTVFSGIYCVLWALTPLISLYDDGLTYYGFAYFALLIFMLLDSKENVFSFLLAFSSFLYFYQFPLINYFAHEVPVYQYNINLTLYQLMRMAMVYNTILLLLYCCIKYIGNNLQPEVLKKAITDYDHLTALYCIASTLAILLIFYGVIRAGGINAYFALNKFEALAIGRLAYFNYNNFAIIGFLLGALSKNKIARYSSWCLISFIIMFNVLSAMRYMLLFGGVLIFAVMVNRVKIWHIILSFSGAILGGVTKLLYYNLKLFAMGKIPAEKIIWFDSTTFYKTVTLFQDGQGNILLFAQYIVRTPPFDYFKLMSGVIINSIPFSSVVWGMNASAGDLMQDYLNIAWGGLASAPYIIPYMCFGLIGVVFIYMLYFLTLYFFAKTITQKSFLISMLFFANIPFTLIYFQRNELSAIYKNFFIEFACILVVLVIFKSVTFLSSKQQ